jgi:hypothetical protein
MIDKKQLLKLINEADTELRIALNENSCRWQCSTDRAIERARQALQNMLISMIDE